MLKLPIYLDNNATTPMDPRVLEAMIPYMTEHFGIAVKDFSSANGLFYKLLNAEPYKTEIVESENVSTSFFKVGDTKIELLEALDDNSPSS